jgi:3-hydroxyacyl-[acyl-carrier-protein] dehydratase
MSPAATVDDIAVGTEHAQLDINDIMGLLPHRPPFLLIDRVTEHKHRESITGYKMVTMNEPFFLGHFPGRPIMPGVLQVEALAQLGGVLIKHLPEGQGKLAVFSGIDKVRFRRMVVPGDKLELHCELIKMRAPIGKAYCRGSVDGETTVEGEMMFSLVDM